MRHTEEETQTVKKIVSIECDMCHKEIKVDNGQTAEDILMIQKVWNPESRWPDEQHQIELCQDCFFKIINHFQIEVETLKVQTIKIG